MQHEYNVKPEDLHWVIASKDSATEASGGKTSKQEMILPEGISINRGPEGKDESQLLTEGDVDALFLAAEPRAFIEGDPIVARLFPDSRKVEQEYYKKTSIFPIMHAIAIKNDTIKDNPWLPVAVFNAYSEAKKIAYEFLQELAWVKIPLPWISQDYWETRKIMGDNYWSYGIKPNRKTLEALFQYSFEQEFFKQKLTIEDLFDHSTLRIIEE